MPEKRVSILIPVYNEGAPALEALREALLPLLDNTLTARTYQWQVMLVDDGSRDDSLEAMRRLHAQDSRFSYVSLSRNFGKENAMLAGMDHVTGDCTVIMDADLQHPVETIPQMLEKWEEGYDDVYGRRIDRGREPWIRRRLSLAYYGLLQRMSPRVPILPNVGDFRLLDRRVVEAVRSLRETQRYTKGLYCWVGFRKTDVPFVQRGRATGKSSFSFWRLFNLAVEGITTYTTAPLRLATAGGLLAALCSILYMLYILGKTIFVGDPVAGFPTLVCLILFLGGCQLVAIGIIGEYIGRIFLQTKNRPPYIIAETDGQKI